MTSIMRVAIFLLLAVVLLGAPVSLRAADRIAVGATGPLLNRLFQRARGILVAAEPVIGPAEHDGEPAHLRHPSATWRRCRPAGGEG